MMRKGARLRAGSNISTFAPPQVHLSNKDVRAMLMAASWPSLWVSPSKSGS